MNKKIFLGVFVATLMITTTLFSATVSTVIGDENDEPQVPDENSNKILANIELEKDDPIILKYNFIEPNIENINIGNECFNRVLLKDSPNGGNVGEPQLPVKCAKILLPNIAEIDKIEIVPSDKVLLGDGYNVEPAQQPIPFSYYLNCKSLPPISKNESIYNSNKLFPGELYNKDFFIAKFRGYNILVLNLYPVQYNPKLGELYYYSELIIKIYTIHKNGNNNLFRGFHEDESEVIQHVDNPSIVTSYNNYASQSSSFTDYDMLILTTNNLKSGFQSLKEAHDAEGTSTIIKTLTDVGSSDPEDIRDYIRDAYNDWGIEYVLLGGDYDVIPARDLWVRASIFVDNIPSDLYYSCLDGTYNYDGDNKWGEYTDGENGGEVDLWADVYVGRACVGNIAEVGYFVNKTIAYMMADDAYLADVLMVGEYIGFGGVAEYGGNYKDEIIDGCDSHGYVTEGIPSSDFNIDTLYDRDCPVSTSSTPEIKGWVKAEIKAKINNNLCIINHLGHANYGYDMKMDNNDVDNLTNNKYCFIYSQGCMAGGFDNPEGYDCIAEHFTVKNSHGAFAGIWNARYGWGAGNSTDGPSQRFDRSFWHEVFAHSATEIGKAHAQSKHWWISWVSLPFLDDCMRWCYYELNLFGDPAIKFKIDPPCTGPELRILQPNPGIYLNDKWIPPLFGILDFPLIIGPISFKAMNIRCPDPDYVKLFVSGNECDLNSTTPYSCYWDDDYFGQIDFKADAYIGGEKVCTKETSGIMINIPSIFHQSNTRNYHENNDYLIRSEDSQNISYIKDWDLIDGGLYNDSYCSVEKSKDNGYILIGNSICNHNNTLKNMGWLTKVKVCKIGNSTEPLVDNTSKGIPEWSYKYSGGEYNLFCDGHQTNDGGFIIVGSTGTFFNRDVWLLKTNETGIIEWEKNFDISPFDMGYGVKQTSDGGYILTGATVGNLRFKSILIKTDGSGNIQWQRIFSDRFSLSSCMGLSVDQTKDNGYIVAGFKSNRFHPLDFDYWLLKTDENGVKKWGRRSSVSTDNIEMVSSVVQTVDGGYAFVGNDVSDGYARIVKTDESGYVNWYRDLGGNLTDAAYEIIQTDDEGFLVCGVTESHGDENGDAWVVKLDCLGFQEWYKTFGGSERDAANAIFETSDGGFILAGFSRSYSLSNRSDKDGWAIKLFLPIEFNSVVVDPSALSTGEPVTITANVTCKNHIEEVCVNITDPYGNYDNLTMYRSGNIYTSTYHPLFTGDYSVYIWAKEIYGNMNVSDSFVFHVTGSPGLNYYDGWDDGVNPNRGWMSNTTFTLKTHYYDPDDEIPTASNVFIDDVSYTMTCEDVNQSNANYTFSIDGVDLGVGTYKYYFYFEDGNGGDSRLPRYGYWYFTILNDHYPTNYPPSVSLASPLNGATDVSINPVFNIVVSDLDTDDVNVTFYLGFGNGSDGDETLTGDYTLANDMNYVNLTIENGVTLDTYGYILKVAGKLTNYGTITDTYSGGLGGLGGAGGLGADPNQNGKASDPKDDQKGPSTPQPGQSGTDGAIPLHPKAGTGGSGAGGGGGAGGAYTSAADANGGNGGNGAGGGAGGGYVRIYAFMLDNQGVIHADGKDGQSGQSGTDGEYFHWSSKDLAGGGGGAGAGGSGGSGGTVEITYVHMLNKSEIHADPGSLGSGGSGGDGPCCSYTTIGASYQPGKPGADGGGAGGRGAYAWNDCAVDGGSGSSGNPGGDGSVNFLSNEITFGDSTEDYTLPDNCTLLEDTSYHNLTIPADMTLDIHGYILKVSGTLTNYGTITDMYSSGSGGSGGIGGKGQDPKQNSNPQGPSQPQPGEPGSPGDAPKVPQAGHGGAGGGSGGGGGGAWWTLGAVDADGGRGGNGGDGGAGGGYVRIYAFMLDNQGVIHADGADGQSGQSGTDGEYYSWGTPVKDLAGGGGGSGAGGSGGSGGTVEITYVHMLNKSEIHADPGSPGNSVVGGSGHHLYYGTDFGGFSWDAPGASGGGDGGYGEYWAFYDSEDGGTGSSGSCGIPGTVNELDYYPNTLIDVSGGSVSYQWVGDLEYETTYYWFATAEDPSGAITFTSPWSFTTELPPVVNLNSGDYYTSVQDAIDNVTTRSNDVIWVRTGTYYENLVVDKPVTIIGEDKNNTILDCMGSTGVFISASGISMSGFTVCNASDAFVVESDNNIITSNIISDIGEKGVSIIYASGNNVSGNVFNRNDMNSVYILGNFTHPSSNNIISSNVVNSGCQDGGVLLLNYCENNDISGNTIDSIGGTGVKIVSCDCNDVYNNRVNDVISGVSLSQSSDTLVFDNEISMCSHSGFGISYGNGNSFYNNVLDDCGFSSLKINSGTDNSVYDNAMNNSNIGVILSHSNGNNVSDNGVSNLSVNGIQLEYSDDNNIIGNVVSAVSNNAICFYSSAGNNVSSNDVENSLGFAVFSDNSASSDIYCNNFSDSGITIYGEENYQYRHNVYGNVLKSGSRDSNRSIYFYKDTSSFVVPSDAGQVILVNCSDATINGLDLSDVDVGIDVAFCNNIDIINCNISDNAVGIIITNSTNVNISCNMIYSSTNISQRSGILLENVSDVLVKGNDISNNYVGIEFKESSNNLIYDNIFNNSFNALDDGFNTWNVSLTPGANIIDGGFIGGNFWSDYRGNDTDGDGLGDTNIPYDSSGNIQNGGDSLPLTSPDYVPVADFTYSPLFPTTADVIGFTDNSSDSNGVIVNWTWNFGDGNISYEQNPTHSYGDDGTYNVSLTVMDDDGATGSTWQLITVTNAGPTADFTWSPTYPTTQDMIQFTDLSSDRGIVNWTWNFNDGNISYTHNPTHQYSDDGSYNVTLTVRDDDSASDSTTKQVTVSNVDPVADYSYSPSSPTTGDNIVFTDNSSDVDGSVVSWYWDFDDGNTSTVQNPNHDYDDGTYNVTLTVWDDDGASGSTWQLIVVVNEGPTADFTWTPTNPSTQDVIQFTDLSNDRSIVNYSWDFDDGNISYEQHPTHQYPDDGTYNVCLTVEDDDGANDIVCKTVTVYLNYPPDKPNTPSGPIECNIGIYYDYQTSTTDPEEDDLFYKFNWGDGNVSDWLGPYDSGETIQISYAWSQVGNYDIIVKAMDIWNQEGSWSNPLSVSVISLEEIIDVNQSTFDRGFPIRHAIDGDWASAQNFTPTLDTLTRVDIYLRKFGTPEFDLTVELREDHPQGTLIDTLIFTSTEVPSSWDWFTLDFTDISVTPGIDYFIVCPPAPSGVTTSFGYEWGYAFGNQYNGGSFWFTRDGGGLWRDLPTMYEFVFRTYGHN